MNKAKLKTYAPQARKDFIAAVEARANLLGLSEKSGMLDIAASEKKGDVAVIAGQAWPAKVHDQRQRLIKRMKKDGFAQTVEAVAYTWFNRFAALRFMEIHDYLGHGHRVLSSREGGLPEIIAHATEVAGSLPGINASQIADMKLAGNKDGELYRLLLVAQCNALSNAMPFLFEHIDDESELLLPGNLERTDSVVAKLVEAIAEEDWNEIEVIGWLYQFYISEKKDGVIGKVVKSGDIPAATQLFTPNWIVQYLVQNSVGRLWLMANPSSTLKSLWAYYIEPTEQTPEVQAQLDSLILTRMAEDGGSLNPETIMVLDPACGSGHILVEAYEVLKAIYLERGYQARAIPRLILEKNLYGLDIDDRAAQMAGFALMMKARTDDRRLLDSPVKLNVMALQESKGLDAEQITGALQTLPCWVGPQGITRQSSHGFGDEDLFPGTHPQMSLSESMAAETSGETRPKQARRTSMNRATIAALIDIFTHAKTFGSLIQIPEALANELKRLSNDLEHAKQSGDVFIQAAAQDLLPLAAQAKLLAMKFDAVVANPPYMGLKAYNQELKGLVERHYKIAKADLYGCFVLRNMAFANAVGVVAMITIPNWMFISSFEKLRDKIFTLSSIESLIHIGRGAFGSDFGTCAFTFRKPAIPSCKGVYKRLFDKFSNVSSQDELSARFFSSKRFVASTDELRLVPGAPLGYWVGNSLRDCFKRFGPVLDVFDAKHGMSTSDNGYFVRWWFEISIKSIGFGFLSRNDAAASDIKWFPYNKGGEFRRWYGNGGHLVNWQYDGKEIKEISDSKYPYLNGNLDFVIGGQKYFFQPGVTWSSVSIGSPSMRYLPPGFIFDTTGQCLFTLDDDDLFRVLAFLNSEVATAFLEILSPTLHFNSGQIAALPYCRDLDNKIIENSKSCIAISKEDWDSLETSWDFNTNPLVSVPKKSGWLADSWTIWKSIADARISGMMELEAENNRFITRAYKLVREDIGEQIVSQVALTMADRCKDSGRLISYAIGCMMGRYSLDEPGLIYAHAGNAGFDASRYTTFPADADGIVPITHELWFDDDAGNRVREFLSVVWGPETLEENLAWVAESLGTKGNETPNETIRRYLSGNFCKDHMQTYKRRPIYWQFSSGKQGAFQALVYLHRYHEGTLARLRAEYVVPLTGKMQSRIEMLEKDRDSAGSTAARTKISKQIESLKKKHVELLTYDEKLRHYADMRIQLDLDDGVKVNYGKFGDLLAEVKAVTGGSSDE
jgi:type II restriction/modification system DNA methylase subunit YeeA